MAPTDTIAFGLILLSAVCVLLELKTAGFGAFGIAGLLALLGGLWLLFGASPYAVPVLVAAALPLVVVFGFLAVLAHRARRNKIVTGEPGMIGLEGRAETDLLPEGRVVVRGELWDAWSPVRLERGATVRVTGVRGLRLEVASASGLPGLGPESIVRAREGDCS